MKKIIITLMVSFAIIACKNNTSKAIEKVEDTQMKRVMTIHDELMPKMSVIGGLISKLKASPDSITHQPLVNKLKRSNDAMMDWMKTFGERFTYEEILKGATLSKQKQTWLNEEEEKVNALKKQMEASITEAEKIK